MTDGDEISALRHALRQALADVDNMRSWLRAHGSHATTCDVAREGGTCTCGLSDLVTG